MIFRPFFIAFILVAVSSCDMSTERKVEVEAEAVIPVQYGEQGKDISDIAQATLMQQVMKAMSEAGPAGAVAFCNIQATGLTDSLSRHFNCEIRRLSLKNRNPDNGPSDQNERTLLNDYLEGSMEGIGLTDSLVRNGRKVIYYRPIFIAMEGCLKCHGIPQKDIDNSTLAVLHEKYPNDRAKGYRLGEFRGMWRITFND